MAKGVKRPAAPRLVLRAALLVLLGAACVSGIWMIWPGQQSVSRVSIEAEGDSVRTALQQHKPTVAEFGSGKCAGCREMKTVLEALARDHGAEVNIVTVDALANRDYLSTYQIQAFPTQIFFDADGREIGRHLGVISAEDILKLLGIPARPGES
jgi:thioredoxin 1